MGTDAVGAAQTWRTTHGDMSDEEWELIADLVSPYWTPGSMGRPVRVDRRRVVDAIFYVAATGCQWRALPESYPNWNTVHRYHLEWSRDGTWERIAERLAAAVRTKEGREASPSAGIVDARSVRAAPTVPKKTKGYDAGKRVHGRKTFGIVDTFGLLMAVAVVAASLSDNVGGIVAADRARDRSAPSPSSGATRGSSAPSSSTADTTTSGSRWSRVSTQDNSRRSPNAGSSSAPGPGS